MTFAGIPGLDPAQNHDHGGDQISGEARLISIYKRQIIDALVEADIDDLDHTDVTAIHEDVDGEIAAITAKSNPLRADLTLIEDSAASNAKKAITLGSILSLIQADRFGQNVDGITNSAFADLDALSGAAFSSPVAVTVTTGTTALVVVSANVIRPRTSGQAFMSYRVSGATTIAADDSNGIRSSSVEAVLSLTYIDYQVGLTAGVNTFELQARIASGGTAQIIDPTLIVVPL